MTTVERARDEALSRHADDRADPRARDPWLVKYLHARHQHWQHAFNGALSVQTVASLEAEDHEELSFNLADATGASSTWSGVHSALLSELTHRGISEDHGTHAAQALADVLLHAIQDDPEPPAGSYAPSARGWLARWREERAARQGRWYTLEPCGQDAEADHAVLRAVLSVLRPWAEQLQTDLPLAARGDWPAKVADAADHLLAVSRRQRGDSADYATTGWLPAEDDAIWQAYVTFAPYALDSDVFSEQVRGFIEVNDDATSVALRLDAEQQARVVSALGGRHLRRLR